MKLSIVIPCYNEEEVIQTTCQKLEGNLTQLIQANDIENYEIIFVDDGSQDNTRNILQQLADINDKVKVVLFTSNFGQQAALLAGILNSSGEAIITMDADLQDPPSYLKDFINQYRKGNDVVIGVRGDRTVDSFYNRFFSEIWYRLAKLLGVPGEYNAAYFMLISRRVRLNLLECRESNLYLRALIVAMKFKTGKVFYKREARFAGTTKYPFGKLVELALNGITSHSVRPLRLIGILGIIMVFISILLILWVLYLKLFTGLPVAGWTSTITIIVFFQGINFMFLAILGEYLGKTYMEAKSRPQYVIEGRINFDQD